MRRRGFITLLGAAAAWPIAAFAQQRLPRVGVLLNGRAVPPGDLQIAAELTRIGYIEGRNIAYEIRGAEGDVTRLPALARELAAVRPEVLFGSTAQIAVALFNATREIPIVITTLSDPIALGLSTSMSRPTRNVTGFTISNLSLAAKRLEILHEVVPASSKVAYLWVPQNPSAALYESSVQHAAQALGINLVVLPLTSEADIVGAFARADEEQVTAVLTEADPLTYRLNGSIVDQCLIRNLPCMHSWSIEVRNGALMSYGPAEPENNARAAVYIDRLLKGAKVAELPFEEPIEIKLAINLRTARSIGLALSPAFVARADEVIE
jgi:putative tryptophan/tyrosine transport system substrate-binding protein